VKNLIKDAMLALQVSKKEGSTSIQASVPQTMEVSFPRSSREQELLEAREQMKGLAALFKEVQNKWWSAECKGFKAIADKVFEMRKEVIKKQDELLEKYPELIEMVTEL
jgi:hypothetical protein